VKFLEIGTTLKELEEAYKNIPMTIQEITFSECSLRIIL
jgi:hypothetical protein